MTFAAEHASAVASLGENGAAVTFTHTAAGTHDAATETFGSPTVSSVTGYAIEVASSSEELSYAAGEMTVERLVTLLFAASTYGDLPALGSEVTWAGETRIVFAVRPLRPDGTTIIARVLTK